MIVSRMRFLSHRARGRLFILACLAGMLVTAVTAVRTEEPPVFAITNAKIIPTAGILIDKGTIVVRRGIIEAVGANASVPPDARMVDGTGLTVYPGLIDAFSDIGLEEPVPARPVAAAAAPAPGRGAQQAPQQQSQSTLSPEERQGVTPYRQAFEMLNPANSRIVSARAAGITTALVMPRRGFFPGQSTLVNLAGAETGQMVVRIVISRFSWPSNTPNGQPLRILMPGKNWTACAAG